MLNVVRLQIFCLFLFELEESLAIAAIITPLPVQKKNSNKKIAIAAMSFGTRAQLGAIQHGSNELGWTVRCFVSAGGHYERMFAWKPDGVFINIDDAEESAPVHRLCVERGIPVVNSTWDCVSRPSVPSVAFNSIQIGQSAAEYFRELGLASFAFVGHPEFLYSRLRLQSFAESLEASGATVNVLHDAEVFDESIHGPQYKLSKETLIVDWLNSLEEGTGIFFANDRQAFIIGEIALHHGIVLQGRFPMLGVDNDPFLCEVMHPKLSSIPVSFEGLGITALEMLKDHFQGQLDPNELRVLEPLPIIFRESTEVQISADPLVQKAMAYIEANLEKDCRVVDVAKHLGVSLPTLHRKFNDHRGHTPYDEIQNRRFRQAERILRETQMSIDQVSIDCGFKSRARFSNAFKERYEMTPSEFRQSYSSNNVTLKR